MNAHTHCYYTPKTLHQVILLHFIILKTFSGRSQWPHGLKGRYAAARLLGLRDRISSVGAWMFASCKCGLLSGRSLCVGLITRPEGSY
jgi:hypothetical protein